MAAAPLRDPQTFRSIYDEHGRGVYAAALRILGDPAQAQDVTQDVFLKLWRSPEKFDARRGSLGPYLKLMGRSRALDLWREGQAAGRASDRLKVVVGQAGEHVDDAPVLRRGARRVARRRPHRTAAAPAAPSARRSCSPTGAA